MAFIFLLQPMGFILLNSPMVSLYASPLSGRRCTPACTFIVVLVAGEQRIIILTNDLQLQTPLQKLLRQLRAFRKLQDTCFLRRICNG